MPALISQNIQKLLDWLRQDLPTVAILPNPPSDHKYVVERRGNFTSSPAAIIYPNNSQEIANILQECNKLHVPVVPLGGNTALVGGGVATNQQIIISLEKLNQILDLNPLTQTITVQAGCTLQQVIAACQQHNMQFPLDLPSRAQACIGGNLATNAGGLNTIKYGQVRNFTLGIEVVLANGKIITDLNQLPKRNIGADYKGLFIGSEGTLGIITAAVFKIYPLPKQVYTILASVDSFSHLLQLFNYTKANFNTQISAFEIMNLTSVEISLQQFKDSKFLNLSAHCSGINKYFPWYALIDLDFYNNNSSNLEIISTWIKQLQQNKIINQYLVSCNTRDLWQCRDNISEAQTQLEKNLKFDLAIPLNKMECFIHHATAAVTNIDSRLLPVIFGHLGDSSLHFNIGTKNNSSNNYSNSNKLFDLKESITNTIIDLTIKHNGSFSAEHGIGLLHVDKLKKYYLNNQIYMLKLFKNMLDPNNILNPNKIIAV